MKPVSVLFVCTGNICRSPTAEGVFRHAAKERGLSDHFIIDSAGTGGWHIGHGPDPRSVATALARGVDISSLRARQLALDDFTRFDHLIALDQTHLDFMTRMKPAQASAQLSLLMAHDLSGKWRDVPDPYYGGQSDFDHAYDLILQGVEELLETLLPQQAHGLTGKVKDYKS